MSQPRAKTFEFAASVDREGRIEAVGASLSPPADWLPEHLVLAALVRCSLTSLRHHARRAGIEVAASGAATGTVARREEDGRYAFVEIECRLDVELQPLPPADELRELIAKAERDCFVGASLRASPRYRWQVNGRDLP